MKNTKKNTGSSLIEVLIALTIVVLVIIALARGVTTAIKSSEASKRGIQAASYAQEGMENIRAFRDKSWKDFNSFAASNSGRNVDLAGTVPSCWMPNCLSCPATANILNIFTRCLKVDETIDPETGLRDPDKFKATVKVSWTDGSGTHSSTLISYFTKSSSWAVNVPPASGWVNPNSGSAYNMSSVDDKVCNQTNILSQNGQVAGLGVGSGGGYKTYDSHDVTACVLADFGSREIQSVQVSHRSVNTTCAGTANEDSCASPYCNTSFGGYVFRGTSTSNWTYVGAFPRQTSLGYTEMNISGAPVTARYILVCRDGSGAARDNIEVDHVQVKI